MARGSAILALAAAIVAGADLVHKAISHADRGAGVAVHPRSALYLIGLTAASALWAVAVVLTRSPSIAAAGGVLAGGAVGNLVSLALWPSVPGVPNPLVAGGVAFNLADLAVAAGLMLVIATTAVFATHNRERLHEPVRLRG
jgi:lipoprotein signal peptidase